MEVARYFARIAVRSVVRSRSRRDARHFQPLLIVVKSICFALSMFLIDPLRSIRRSVLRNSIQPRHSDTHMGLVLVAFKLGKAPLWRSRRGLVIGVHVPCFPILGNGFDAGA